MRDAAGDGCGTRRDDTTDFTSWVQTYGPALRRFFARRMGQTDADELVQDVFLAVHRYHGDRHVLNPQGYLFTTARHLLARRKTVQIGSDGIDYALLGALETVSPERELIAKQELERVLSAIEKLPTRAREAFILHRFEEMTYRKIASHMGISLSAVRQLISRSLQQIIIDIGGPQ